MKKKGEDTSKNMKKRKDKGEVKSKGTTTRKSQAQEIAVRRDREDRIEGQLRPL